MIKNSFHQFIVVSLGCVLLWACSSKTEQVVEERYADGKAQHVKEYKITKDGEKTLSKETFYFPEEKKYIEGTYNTQAQRDGKWTSWYENGLKNSEGTYKNGLLEGKYTVWYPNGVVFYKGHYTNGQKTGTWLFYDSLGVQIKKETYTR
ncbi:MAG: hypothetical protein J5606_02365 [Bacteroidales bacterium]|nr:hypothetical protein [Bacteroidales bacterium]